MSLSPSDRIRHRLLALAGSTTQTAENSSPDSAFGQRDGTKGEPDDDWARQDDEVIDAEVVDDPEPPIVAQAEPTMTPVAGMPEPERPAYPADVDPGGQP